MSRLNKDKMVKQIAKDLFLREELVQEVLDKFVDIAIEEIVNEGDFQIHRLFSIVSREYKGYENSKGRIPATRRLSIRLSSGVHKLYRFSLKPDNDYEKYDINRNNWREFLSTIESNEKTNAREPMLSETELEKYDTGYKDRIIENNTENHQNKNSKTDNISTSWNPFLDDEDDEDYA
mgnify:CR=1 FL=1